MEILNKTQSDENKVIPCFQDNISLWLVGGAKTEKETNLFFFFSPQTLKDVLIWNKSPMSS